jgi:hypothetical protein
VKKRILLLLIILPSLLATAAERMSGTTGSGRELSFYDEPYRITITIPDSRDTFKHRVISEAGRFQDPGRRFLADFAFTPPGGGPPHTSMMLFVFDRYRSDDESVTLPINPTLQEFVVEYNARNGHFHPSLHFPQVQAGNVSTLKIGDRIWLKVIKWSHESRRVQYVTIIDDKRMFVLDWLPPRDTFFKRNRAARKWPEIESMLASVRLSRDPKKLGPVDIHRSYSRHMTNIRVDQTPPPLRRHSETTVDAGCNTRSFRRFGGAFQRCRREVRLPWNKQGKRVRDSDRSIVAFWVLAPRRCGSARRNPE